MIGAVSVDSKTCPCLCLDAMPSCNFDGGDLKLQRHPMGKVRVPRLELSSSFFDWNSVKFLSGAKSFQKQKKNRRLVGVDELAGQYEDNFEDVKRLCCIHEHGYGKRFIRNLGKRCDHTEMYERISDQNLELMRERLVETVVWPTDDTFSGMDC